MKIYLAKSNHSNPDVLINTRAILLRYGEVIEYQGKDWERHRHLIAESDMVIIVGHEPDPNVNEPVPIGRGLFSTLSDFYRRYGVVSDGRVLYASLHKARGIKFNEILTCQPNDDTDWTYKFGMVTLAKKDFGFTEFLSRVHELIIPSNAVDDDIPENTYEEVRSTTITDKAIPSLALSKGAFI